MSTCFNLDVHFPIIYRNSFDRTDKTNFFGYSVILYGNGNLDDSWIQIGAPSGGIRDNKKKGTGAVYRCKIFGPCSLLDINGNSETKRWIINYVLDKLDGAWIGGSMDIDERIGRVVVCGHRWTNNLTLEYYMQGACYWSYVNETRSQKVIPLADLYKASRTDLSTGIGYYYYGQGQAGMAAHFSNSLTEPELVLGAPGVYNWGGTTLMYQDVYGNFPEASKLVQSRTKRAFNRGEFSSLNIANAVFTTQIGAFGLFGYAVTSGYFFNKSEILYISGAPRSKNYRGQILVYNFEQFSDQALNVRDSREGQQGGEYFGAALTAGDIDMDGFDDVIVGSPFYADTQFNQGRIYVFLGSSQGSLKKPQKSAFIDGKGIGGQFGMCVMYLGDFHNDGRPVVAVGAPYENDGSGVVYIYKSDLLKQGLENQPIQILTGTTFNGAIKGFGISISKARDIDNNSFNDVAIGAYLSDEVILLRGKPIVTIHQTVTPLIPYLEYRTKEFVVIACYWYVGNPAPPSINITRRIVIDEVLKRAYLTNDTALNETISLMYNATPCENITVVIQSNIVNYHDPITVSVSNSLIEIPKESQTVFVTNESSSDADTFCKHCPITQHPVTEQTKNLPFATLCGDDNVCTSNLHLETKFPNIDLDNASYVLGSTNNLTLEMTVINSGENAYQTQVLIDLPKSVYFRSITSHCVENSSSAIICNFDNPLYSTENKTRTVDLDVTGIDTIRYGDVLTFTLTVLTSSKNINNNVFKTSLKILKKADITITGKPSQQSYSYGNDSNLKPNFTHIYQVEKLGVSPIDEVLLTVLVPTKYFDGVNWIRFADIYMPEGTHANQPINCKSTDDVFILAEDKSDLDIQTDSFSNTSTKNEKMMLLSNNLMEFSPVKRSIRSVSESSDVNDGNSTSSINNTYGKFQYAPNRIFFLNCSNTERIICSHITCNVGPFKAKQNVARLLVKVRLNVTALFAYLGTKNIIGLSTDGFVVITSPPNLVQSGDKPDDVKIYSVFVGASPAEKVELWIIIVAVIAGLLLLILLVIALIKVGFFQRKKKEKLKALIEAEEIKQFHQDAKTNEKSPEDDQSHQLEQVEDYEK